MAIQKARGAMSTVLIQPSAGPAIVESSSTLATEEGAFATAATVDDLSRKVYGLLGIPVDAIGFSALQCSMEAAADSAAAFLISTPNVNFLVKSQQNVDFRQSILMSDLCLPDGMPLIWIAKLLRIPIYDRIAGADLFGRLKLRGGTARKLKVFLLGGADGVGDMVSEKLNSQECGLECVGVLNPGFGTIEEMSTTQIIDTINSSRADLLAVFFGAEKAQAWLMHNHCRLQCPIRAQFGATINFEAGTVKRAPPLLRSTGFEWLWRIKEEPYLWRRYWSDGRALLKLIVTCVLPLVFEARRGRGRTNGLQITVEETVEECVIHVSGDAVGAHIDPAIRQFRIALNMGKEIKVNISRTSSIDPRFFGLLLMVHKSLQSHGKHLRFTGASAGIRRLFRLNRFELLLSHERGTSNV